MKKPQIDYTSLLRAKGLKATPKRIAVLELLNKDAKPLTIAQIIAKLRGISFDQATIYRTLESLQESGFVAQVELKGSSKYFEAVRPHHHHVVCTNCDAVEDIILDESFRSQEKGIEKKTKFSIQSHSLEFYGLCATCKK